MSDSVEVTATIAAPPQTVYALISDLARMGEWSPETTGVTWLGEATEPRIGARFRGTNRNGMRRWSTICTVLAAEPGRELAWESRLFGRPVALWRYRFEPDGNGGTKVTETTEDQRRAGVPGSRRSRQRRERPKDPQCGVDARDPREDQGRGRGSRPNGPEPGTRADLDPTSVARSRPTDSSKPLMSTPAASSCASSNDQS